MGLLGFGMNDLLARHPSIRSGPSVPALSLSLSLSLSSMQCFVSSLGGALFPAIQARGTSGGGYGRMSKVNDPVMRGYIEAEEQGAFWTEQWHYI